MKFNEKNKKCYNVWFLSNLHTSRAFLPDKNRRSRLQGREVGERNLFSDVIFSDRFIRSRKIIVSRWTWIFRLCSDIWRIRKSCHYKCPLSRRISFPKNPLHFLEKKTNRKEGWVNWVNLLEPRCVWGWAWNPAGDHVLRVDKLLQRWSPFSRRHSSHHLRRIYPEDFEFRKKKICLRHLRLLRKLLEICERTIT